jgi:hypothetical protein
MKKLQVRKIGPVRLTSALNPCYTTPACDANCHPAI